jgi:4,5-dihydroxyphthalate decarboxylase
VTGADFDFDFEEVPVLVKGFRRMVRELAYDISEMALTTYICAKAHGVKFTALPIFLVRDFHHGAIAHNVKAGLATPEDLEGRRVGVNRGYTVTTGVWARSILQDEYDVDLSRVTWVPSGDEHVADFQPPSNVDTSVSPYDLAQALGDGVLPAAVGTEVDHPDVAPMIGDPIGAGMAALKSRGLYPINHLIVVRDDVLAAHPDLGAQVFEAFAASKQLYLADLKAGRIAEPTAADKVHLAAMQVMDDPLPYGIAPNQRVLEMLMAHAVTQGIIPGPMALGDLFDPSTHDLVG